MIVDFILIKAKLHQAINIALREEIKRRTPFLSQIQKHILHEGDKHLCENTDHEKEEMKMQVSESRFTLSREEMSAITAVEIFEKLKESAEDMAGQMEKGTFRTLMEEMEKHNRSVPGNPAFSPEAFLKALEMIDIEFEDDLREKPHLPTLIMHPDLAKKAKEQEESMTAEEKDKFDKRMEEIMDQKYREYMSREEVRKIID